MSGGIGSVGILRIVIREALSEDGLKAGRFILNYELNEKNAKVLMTLVRLVMETRYTKAETKEMLRGNGSYRHCNHVEGAAVNSNTSRSRIYYDICKLKRILGEGLAVSVLLAGEEELYAIGLRLDGLVEKYGRASLLRGFKIRIPEEVSQCRRLSEGEHKALKVYMKFYSNKGFLMAEKGFTGRMAGYIKYLESNVGKLTEDEAADYEVARGYLETVNCP